MNTENTKKSVARKLDSLSDEQKNFVLETAANARLIDVVESLREYGIVTSVPTLSRFLQRDREKRLLEDGKAMRESVVALAERGKDGVLREGSLEAVRQRLYERVLVSNDPEEALRLYNAMLKEEAKVKELDLEARKVKVSEEQVRLQAIKLAGVGRKPAPHLGPLPKGEGEVVESSIVTEELSGRERKLSELVRDLAGIVNGSGTAEEKVLAARVRLGSEGKLLSEQVGEAASG
jgi:hypothetical protein